MLALNLLLLNHHVLSRILLTQAALRRLFLSSLLETSYSLVSNLSQPTPMSPMSPRPILKRSSSSTHANEPELPFHGIQAVHFPPSPSLNRFYTTHPSSTYDRSPIVVSPNSCALPERGCPGRTYTLDERNASVSQFPINLTPTPRGGHLHPRALSQRQHPQNPFPPCPPLIQDLSSESEESDGFISSPPEPFFAPNSFSHRSNKYPSHLSLDKTAYFAVRMDIRPPSPPRKSQSHRDRDWMRNSSISGEVAADDPGYEDDHDIPTVSIPRSISPKKNRCRKSLSSKSRPGFNDADEGGCLDGF